MASAERRRRKRHGAGKPMEVAAQEMKDSVKGPDCIERLAHKYMQKCMVESSTESESESSVEVVPRPLAGGLRKARDSRGLQFLDPYDGDSEDASIQAGCSLSPLNSRKMALLVNSGPKALEDADTSEHGKSFPKPPDWPCPETKVGEIQTVNDCKEPMELPSQGKDFLRSLLQSSDLSRARGAGTSTWLTPDHPLLVSINPSASADLLTSPGDSTPLPLLAADCGGTTAQQPLTKRKHGVPIPEGACEKLRKKFRAT